MYVKILFNKYCLTRNISSGINHLYGSYHYNTGDDKSLIKQLPCKITKKSTYVYIIDISDNDFSSQMPGKGLWFSQELGCLPTFKSDHFDIT